jgi:hypothetical protein
MPNEELGWYPDLYDFQAVCQGELQRFRLTPDDHVQAGIDPAEQISGADEWLDRIIHAFRMLCHHLPAEDLFLLQRELLEYVGRPADLPLFLHLDEWCHPGAEGIDGPSASPCLRSLAAALAHNDPSLFACDPRTFNIHWSDWPRFVITQLPDRRPRFSSRKG